MTASAAMVGPVLQAGEVAEAVVQAIRSRHADAKVENRGAYIRVRVAGRCILRRSDVEEILGREVLLRMELQHVMPAFAGRLILGADEVVWE